jgi:HNH endonuclease
MPKSCEYCGCKLVRRPKECPGAFPKRRFCSKLCAGASRRENLAAKIVRLTLIDPNTGCWICVAGKNAYGYGVMHANGRTIQAHILSWTLKYGPVPKGMELHHMCENKLCCNPKHLEPITRAAHLMRSRRSLAFINKHKTHCKHAHEFTPENTLLSHDGKQRRCKACARARGPNIGSCPRFISQTRAHPYDLNL